MWEWMHKKKQRSDAFQISYEENREIKKLPASITQMVTEAVKHYNDMVSLASHLEGRNVNELLIREAEEEDAKVFLDGIFDIVQIQR